MAKKTILSLRVGKWAFENIRNRLLGKKIYIYRLIDIHIPFVHSKSSW